jgi:hypothetical protein
MKPLTAENAATERLHSAVVGRSLSSVRYWMSEPGGGTSVPGNEADSVELGFGADVVLIRWAMDGAAEGLHVVVSSHVEPGSQEALEVVDAARQSVWKDLSGLVIREVRVAWHEVETDGPLLLWAVGFGVGDDTGACVALGELRGGVPTYTPDALVVMSAESARRYRPPAARGSAWGVPLAT